VLRRLLPSIGVRAVPKGAALRSNLLLSLQFALLFGIVYVGADLLGGHLTQRYSVALPLDSGIPFVPQMAIVYLSIIPLMILAPFVMNTPRQLFPLVFVLSLEVLLAGLIFIVFPIEEMARNRAANGPGLPFAVADTLNLRFNYLPSLHVALSVTVATACAKSCEWPGKVFYGMWALLISASSVLTHQHYLADVAAGAILAAAGMLLVYPWVSRPDVLNAFRVEWICAGEFLTFARRHRRYLLIAAIIYWHAMFRWSKSRVLRVGFCLLQVIDDLLDGDRACDREPSIVAADVLQQLETGDFRSDRLGILAQSMATELSRLQTESDRPLADSIALIRHMMLDRERANDRALFSHQELRRHHRVTFRHSLNLLLVAVGAKARADDVPELVEAFGWCSAMRDLREDLAHGLVNIPEAVVRSAECEGAKPGCDEKLLGSQAVRAWQAEELDRAQRKLQSFGRRRWDPVDPVGNRVLRLFHRSIVQFASRMQRDMMRGT